MHIGGIHARDGIHRHSSIGVERYVGGLRARRSRHQNHGHGRQAAMLRSPAENVDYGRGPEHTAPALSRMPYAYGCVRSTSDVGGSNRTP